MQDELLEQEMHHVEADVNAILNTPDLHKKKHASKNN
jgi:hypothetical protein